MPVKSPKQFRFFQAIARGYKPKKGIGGLSPSVAKEYLSKTSKKKKSMFARAGR